MAWFYSTVACSQPGLYQGSWDREKSKDLWHSRKEALATKKQTESRMSVMATRWFDYRWFDELLNAQFHITHPKFALRIIIIKSCLARSSRTCIAKVTLWYGARIVSRTKNCPFSPLPLLCPGQKTKKLPNAREACKYQPRHQSTIRLPIQVSVIDNAVCTVPCMLISCFKSHVETQIEHRDIHAICERAEGAYREKERKLSKSRNCAIVEFPSPPPGDAAFVNCVSRLSFFPVSLWN